MGRIAVGPGLDRTASLVYRDTPGSGLPADVGTMFGERPTCHLSWLSYSHSSEHLGMVMPRAPGQTVSAPKHAILPPSSKPNEHTTRLTYMLLRTMIQPVQKVGRSLDYIRLITQQMHLYKIRSHTAVNNAEQLVVAGIKKGYSLHAMVMSLIGFANVLKIIK